MGIYINKYNGSKNIKFLHQGVICIQYCYFQKNFLQFNGKILQDRQFISYLDIIVFLHYCYQFFLHQWILYHLQNYPISLKFFQVIQYFHCLMEFIICKINILDTKIIIINLHFFAHINDSELYIVLLSNLSINHESMPSLKYLMEKLSIQNIIWDPFNFGKQKYIIKLKTGNQKQYIDLMDYCTADCLEQRGQFDYGKSCMVAQELCNQDLVQFIQGYFCYIHQSFFLLIILGVIIAASLYKIMEKLASDYLAPCVEQFICTFKISKLFAGVTFLAFANGSPDVFTALVASSSSSSATTLIPFGSIFGAALVSMAVILPAVVFAIPTDKLKVPPRQIIKPLIFYGIGLGYLLLVAFIIKKITVLSSILLPILYITYIVTVVWGEKKNQKAQKDKFNQQMIQGEYKQQSQQKINQQKKHQLQPKLNGTNNQQQNSANNPINNIATTGQNEGNLDDNFKTQITINNDIVAEEVQKASKRSIRYCLNFISQVQTLLFSCILPPFKTENWKPLKCFSSFLIAPFILFVALKKKLPQSQDLSFLLYLSIPSILLSLHTFIICVTGWNRRFVVVYTLYCFTICIGLLAIVCSVLINLVQLFQLLTNVNPVFIGLTVFSFVNSVQDYLSITKFASKGNAATAIAGIFSGQLFNFLIGFGTSLIIQAVNGKDQFNLFEIIGNGFELVSKSMVIAVLLCTFIFVILMIILTNIQNGVFGHKQAYICLCFYLGFFIIALGLSIASDFFRKKQCQA